MKILSGILLSSIVVVASISAASARDSDYRRGYRHGTAQVHRMMQRQMQVDPVWYQGDRNPPAQALNQD